MSILAMTRDELERVVAPDPPFHCVVCGADGFRRRPRVRAEGSGLPFEMVCCGGCGLVQQHPRAGSRRIDALYDEHYYVFSEADELRWARAVQLYIMHLAGLEDRGGLRLLDLGCALGHVSALARERGWRVTAVDLSAQAASQAAARFGLDVRAGSLERHRGTLYPFDVILLADVLEHVAAPSALMREVRDVLAPNGVVCIDTPNWGSRWRRWGRSSWLGLNRFHVNLFDAEALAKLLTNCGFASPRFGSYTHYRYESWSSRPEVRAWVEWLPRPFSWRVNRALGGHKSSTLWSPLRQSPPGTLEEALALIDEIRPARDVPDSAARLDGDNLCAKARAA